MLVVYIFGWALIAGLAGGINRLLLKQGALSTSVAAVLSFMLIFPLVFVFTAAKFAVLNAAISPDIPLDAPEHPNWGVDWIGPLVASFVFYGTLKKRKKEQSIAARRPLT